MEGKSYFEIEAMKASNERLLKIINHRENFADGLHNACLVEARSRNVDLDNVDLENLLPFSELEELTGIKHDLIMGLTDENVISYLVNGGHSIAEAEEKLSLAKRLKYVVKEEEDKKPVTSLRSDLFKFFMILLFIVNAIRYLYKLNKDINFF